MNQELEEVYRPSMIYSLHMEHKENWVVYDDSDSQTDYFHSTRGSARYIASCMKSRGADQIQADPINNSDEVLFHKRAKLIAKLAGYDVEYKEEKQHYRDMNINKEWTKRYFIFTRKEGNPRFQDSLKEQKRTLDIEVEQLINTPEHEKKDWQFRTILNTQRVIRGMEQYQ